MSSKSYPTYDDNAYRVEMFGDEIESLSQIDPLFGTVKQRYMRLPIYPKTHYVMKEETRASAVASIKSNWPGGKRNWKSRDGWSNRSASISA
jgi:excinuclease UvrABC helicase subunit UvrB